MPSSAKLPEKNSTVFELHRNRLRGIAYRITGSVSDSEDALQEAWLRWQALPADQVDRISEPRAWLTTVISRICYDQLTSARARRETYVGPWLPEPVVSEGGPEERAVLDESVSLALLRVMERLSPAERTAFVLHDVFAVPFPEIADALGRSAGAVRQLASRARRQVRAQAPRRSLDRAEHRRAVEAFRSAVLDGDFDALLAVLHPEVVWHSDGGGKVIAARVPVHGVERVAQVARRIARDYDPTAMRALLRDVNGAPGIVITAPEWDLTAVLGFTVHEGRITAVDFVINPDKLSHLTAHLL